jgi:hypothetical protein
MYSIIGMGENSSNEAIIIFVGRSERGNKQNFNIGLIRVFFPSCSVSFEYPKTYQPTKEEKTKINK